MIKQEIISKFPPRYSRILKVYSIAIIQILNIR